MAALDFPASPSDGTIYNGTNGVTYIYIADGASGYWSGAATANNEAPKIEVGPTPPAFPKEGDLWWDSKVNSARLYVFYADGDSNQWVESSPAAGEDSIDNLWKKVGNDLSPIEDTDNVVVVGSGTFEGDVTTGDPTFASEVVQVRAGGQVIVRNDGTAPAVWQVYNGGTSTSNITSQIDYDGSATFSGNISHSSYDQSGSTGGGYSIQGYPLGGGYGGSIRVQNTAGLNNYTAFQVFNGTTPSASWRQDGTIDIGGTLVGGGASHKPNITLNADGSASFANDATTITSSGIVQVSRTLGTNDCFEAQLNGVAKATIKAEGTATFKDNVKIDSTFAADTWASLNANGLVCQNPVSDSTNTFFRGRTGSGDNKFSVYTNGNASFSGSVSAEKYGSFRTTINDGSDISFELRDSSGQVTSRFWGNKILGLGGSINGTYDSASPLIQLNGGDGTAIFTGSVTSNGSILTRAGGVTLDVGDRLEKVDAALTALKAALVTTTDHASLKAALITALADI